MQPVRWGILSTAKIAKTKVIPGMLKSAELRVAAIASRDLSRAEAAARELGIPKAYGSYEALLADPEIEAVYNPLPNDQHVALTIAAARAGKHVLCEKPFAMNAAGIAPLIAMKPAVLIAEAFMIRHHPQWIRAREIIASDEIGELKSVQAAFSYFNADPANIRNRLETGGGALMDIGCYALMSGRLLFGADPARVIALIDSDPAFRTDRHVSGLADFGAGRQLSFSVSTQAAPYQRVLALGTKGRVEIIIPFNAPQGEATLIYTDTGAQHGDGSRQAVMIPPADQYQLQAEAFSRAIRGAEPLAAGLEDALLNMRILDAMARSEKSGAWERP